MTLRLRFVDGDVMTLTNVAFYHFNDDGYHVQWENGNYWNFTDVYDAEVVSNSTNDSEEMVNMVV
jgi:hypothetical protein